VTVTVDRARGLPALVSAEATGHIQQFHGYHAWTAAEFVVDSSEPVIDVGVDGEGLRLPPPLTFRSLPGALRVRTPITAPGVSPAAGAPQGVWDGRYPPCCGCSRAVPRPRRPRPTPEHGAQASGRGSARALVAPASRAPPSRCQS
jgi:hypothetical protein